MERYKDNPWDSTKEIDRIDDKIKSLREAIDAKGQGPTIEDAKTKFTRFKKDFDVSTRNLNDSGSDDVIMSPAQLYRTVEVDTIKREAIFARTREASIKKLAVRPSKRATTIQAEPK